MVASCSSFSMFFEELVQQHRIHRFVTVGCKALVIAGHQIRVYLRYYLLSHEVELRDTLWVEHFK